MASVIQVRVEDELREKSDELFKSLGTDTTSAIRMFLTQAIAQNGFPFEIKRFPSIPYEKLSEEEIISQIENARRRAECGMTYDAKSMVAETSTKYGL